MAKSKKSGAKKAKQRQADQGQQMATAVANEKPNALTEGRRAFEGGLAVGNNPYSPGTQEAQDWATGFDQTAADKSREVGLQQAEESKKGKGKGKKKAKGKKAPATSPGKGGAVPVSQKKATGAGVDFLRRQAATRGQNKPKSKKGAPKKRR